MMELVKQEAFGQCGAACIAMVLGGTQVTLEVVVAELEKSLGDKLSNIGLNDGEMATYLREYGKNALIILDWDGQEKAILTVPSLNHRGLLHYIVWDGSRFLDPSTGPFVYPNDAPVINGEKIVCWTTAIVWNKEIS